MDLAGHIAALPPFEGLPKDQLDDLARILVEEDYGQGQTIFSQGDEWAGFYVVGSGRVKIYKLSPEGKEQILHIFRPREPFGELAVFAGRRFPAHAADAFPMRMASGLGR